MGQSLNYTSNFYRSLTATVSVTINGLTSSVLLGMLALVLSRLPSIYGYGLCVPRAGVYRIGYTGGNHLRVVDHDVAIARKKSAFSRTVGIEDRRLLQISSLQNSRIKNLVKLTKRRERDEQRITVVEGLREIGHALDAGVIPWEVYMCPPLLDEEGRALQARVAALAADQPTTTLFEVTEAVFAKIAYRGDSGGLLLTIPYLDRPLSQLPLGDPPFVVVIEGVEKPGNLGAILRTADAAGVDGVVVCAGATDLHNPNVVRASLGALFTLPIAAATTAEVLTWLQQRQIQAIAASPDGKTIYTTVPLTTGVAIVMGSEALGLSTPWLTTAAATVVTIPMYGRVDSLNLSAATAVMLYEVVRQRHCAHPCA